MGRLTGKTAFITGAARGQGRSHAIAMAREGANVAVADICDQIEGIPYPMSTVSDLEETVRLVEAEGGQALSFVADARDSAAMRAAAAETVERFGRIDAGLINHGVVRIGSWDSISDDDFDIMIETNLSSVWRAARAVIPHLIEAGGGSLIFTASACGIRPGRGLIDYTAAKHGVVGLAKALAIELGPHWVRVNAVCPSTVFSPMVNNQVTLDLFSGGPGGSAEKAAFPALAQMALPVPWMEEEAISQAMLYLTSDESKYVTGTAFLVDGGAVVSPSGIPPVVSTRLAELGVQLTES